MEATEQINKFKEFIESAYLTTLSDNLRKNKKFLVIEFNELSKFNIELAELILEQPEDTIKAAEMAIEQFDIDDSENTKVRFNNLPESQKIMIKDIRSKHLNKLFQIEGVIRQKSDVRPQVTAARFECPGCGNILNVLQLDSSFREPTRCSCGRKGKFSELSKELVDAQGLVLEEDPEQLEGGHQPKRMNVFLKDDLVSPISEQKTAPGSKIKVIGIIKDAPIILKTGAKSTKLDLLIEANYMESIEETFYELEISKEDEQKIIELSEYPDLRQKLIESVAPSIYGYEQVKEAILLQMVGGVHKTRRDGIQSRGDMHVLLVGDPGCVRGDSQIALIYKGMKEIKSMGNTHLQPINEFVTKIRKNGNDRYYDVVTTFYYYPNQPTLKIITETGKELVCTYNQPLLTKKGWKRADELSNDILIRVMPKIPTMVKKEVSTNFKEIKSRNDNRRGIVIPYKFTPELASLCGYIIGDGYISRYRVACCVNSEETDLIDKLNDMFKRTFNIIPQLTTRQSKPTFIIEGDIRRIINPIQSLYILRIDSKQISNSLLFLSNKRVPQQIFQSPKNVISSFLSWLYDADGCAFAKGRGRTAIKLKSNTSGLLHDVQLLLLYFGIQSRIIGDDLFIRRFRDIELFAKYIGFNSEKKKNKLNYVLEYIKTKNKRRDSPQRYEKIIKIIPFGNVDVYDFEVPKSHTFIANGIVCHNSGKSALLKRANIIAPKSRYVSGKGASSVGLTAAVVKDEFLKGWSLEAGAMVLASNGLCTIDELNQMTPEDKSSLHEAMENQTVSISKANIQATLIARTTVLAAANPKFGRFDPYGIIAEQIDLPPALINRFDLIFTIKDIPDKQRDDELATHMLDLHENVDVKEPPIDTHLLKKYIGYAKRKIKPKLTKDAIREIKKYYLKMRDSISGEGKITAIPISPRQLEALVRLSEANARIRLSLEVTGDDAGKAISILEYCLKDVAFDYETGKIDIDKIATGTTSSQRSHIIILKSIILRLKDKFNNLIPLDDIVADAKSQGIEESKIEELIEKMKQVGDIFEPRNGFIQILGMT